MRLSLIFVASILVAQNPAFDVQTLSPRIAPDGNISPIAHLRAKDGGRFVVSRTGSPSLPLENPFQAVHSGSSIALSSDGGASFAAIEVPGIKQVQATAFGRRTPGRRYVLGDGGAFAVSNDAGVSWQTYGEATLLINVPLAVSTPSFQDIQLIVDPRDENFVYRRISNPDLGTFTDHAGLVRWNPGLGRFIPVPGGADKIGGPYLRPRANQLFAATANALYVSAAPDGPWDSFATIPTPHTVREAVFDVAGTRRIYILTSQGAVLVTNDDGANWRALDLGFRAAYIAANPNRAGHVLFYGDNRASLAEAALSLDGGATVVAVEPTIAPSRLVEFDPSQPNIAYSNNRRRISRDSGRTWQDNSPRRAGRQFCSPLEPQICYALAGRFENFYIEKFDANGELQWASYWGDNDSDAPRSAFVDKDGILWLNTGRKIARITPDGQLKDVRPSPAGLADIVQLGNGRLVGIVAGNVAELREDNLVPLAFHPAADASHLVPAQDQVAFLASNSVYVFRPGEALSPALPPEANFLPQALAWAQDGSLLIAGNKFVAIAPRRSAVVLLSWSNSSYQTLATLQGESSEAVEHIAVDPVGRLWLFGVTSSQRFPLRSPIFSGPPRTALSGFAALLRSTGGEPLFSTHTPGFDFPLAGPDGLDVLRMDVRVFGGLGGPGFAPIGPIAIAPVSFTPFQLRAAAGTSIRIDAVERRFDSSGGNWSKGSWLRVRSADLAALPPFELPVWSPDRPTAHSGARLMLNGQALTLIGAGPGFLEAALDKLDSDENGALAQLTLEYQGASSQTLRLGIDRFDYELLPRSNNPDIALCYNSDGTENSEANPAIAGSQVALFAVGAQGSPEVYLNPQQVGDFDRDDVPTYSSDYVEDVPGVLPGIRYIGLTLRGLGRFSGTRKVGLYRYYEDQPSLYIWVRGQ